MKEQVTIAVDAMGGDNAPQVVLDGCESALAKDKNLTIMLCGPEAIVVPFCEGKDRCEPVIAEEVIEMGEHPANAVRKKKNSSIVVGCRLVKEGKADGFFSAGSTGACLSAATLVMGRIKGVKRPALATIIPSPVQPCILTDCGANADCKPEYIKQFAIMGRLYVTHLLGVEKPRVGLLNIGAEETKGNEFALQCYDLLKDTEGFVGNVEGTKIMLGTADLLISDGFTGNVALKTLEGTAKTLFSAIKSMMTKDLKSKIGALCLKDGLYELKDLVNPDTYGGAPLLGVKGGCMIGHGSSNAFAIANGVAYTAKMCKDELPAKFGVAIAESVQGGDQ